MTEKFAQHSWFPVAGSMVAVAWGGNESVSYTHLRAHET